jgi:hypothetical protein
LISSKTFFLSSRSALLSAMLLNLLFASDDY